jgi:hypothetical protein
MLSSIITLVVSCPMTWLVLVLRFILRGTNPILKTSGIGSAGEEKLAKRSIPPAESYSAYRCKNKNSIIDKTIYTTDYIDT